MQIQMTEQSAVDLLALMSMFDRQGVSMALLRKSTSKLDFDDALAPLLSFSLVQAEVGKQSLPHSREAMSHAEGDEEDMLNQAKIGLS